MLSHPARAVVRLFAAGSLALLAACSGSDRLTAPDAAFSTGSGATDTGRNPILFVHGYNSSGSTWTTMVGRFKQDGWTDAELHAWTYDFRQSNAKIAEQLKAKVDEILAGAPGATKVDIITHSMGGLSSRYYTKNLGGDIKVDAWVSLGGPNHGTRTAICLDVSCVEMRVGSTFLKNLNARDETPGVSRYATWWSGCDEVIDPKDSVVLKASDATNTRTACMLHSRLKEDATVYAQVRDFVKPAT